jgi:hypothetical protein
MSETHPQNRRLDSQLEQLRAAGCTAKIYREKVTGASFSKC